MLYIGNAFSLGMLPASPEGLTLRVRPIHVGDLQGLLQINTWQSVVGHAATAAVMSALLGVEIPVNRVSITLKAGDGLVVFQLGIRLAEGQVLSAEEVAALVEEGKATFWLVEILEG